MLLDRDKKTLFITSIVSIVLSLIVCIPFKLSEVTQVEIIVKYLVIAAIIAVITIMGFSMKYRNYRPANKYATVVTYAPLFSYAAAVLYNTLTIIARNNSVYSANVTLTLTIVVAALLVVVLALTHLYYKAVIALSKNEAMLVDGLFAVLALVFVLGAAKVAGDYKAAGAFAPANTSALFYVVPVVLGISAALLVILSIKYLKDTNEEYVARERKDVLQLWLDNNAEADNIYETAREDILVSLYDFASEQLGLDDYELVEEDEEAEVKEVQVESEEAKEEIAALKQQVKELKAQNKALKAKNAKQSETIKKLEEHLDDTHSEVIIKSLEESLDVINGERKVVQDTKARLQEENDAIKAELQAKIDAHNAQVAQEEAEAAAKAEAERLEAERKAQEALEREKNKKQIEPAFDEFVAFAKTIGADRDDMEVQENEKGCKVLCHGKMVANMQVSTNDYKFSFLATDETMRTLLYQYNGIVTFDRSITYPTAEYIVQVLKASYKGDETITADAIKELLANAVNVLVEAEAKEEEAKAAVKAAKERAKAAEKALQREEKAAAKEAAKAEKEAAKAAEEQAKAEAEAAEQPAEEAQPVEEQPAEENKAE